LAIVHTADTCSGAEDKRKERWSGGICICCVYDYENDIVSQLLITCNIEDVPMLRYYGINKIKLNSIKVNVTILGERF
jgi:hypothetical protein